MGAVTWTGRSSSCLSSRTGRAALGGSSTARCRLLRRHETVDKVNDEEERVLVDVDAQRLEGDLDGGLLDGAGGRVGSHREHLEAEEVGGALAGAGPAGVPVHQLVDFAVIKAVPEQKRRL